MPQSSVQESNTRYLWDDLAENGNDNRRKSKPDQPGRELRHDDRQQGVHSHVAQQQRAQQQVTISSHRLNFLRRHEQARKSRRPR